MNRYSFQFVSNEQALNVPLMFRHLMDISSAISQELIINSSHTYYIKSNVSSQVFQAFINYLVNDEIPDVQFTNINDYIKLCQEFNILNEFIETKRQQFGEHLINLNYLRNRQNQNLAAYEKEVAKKLDDYLEDPYCNEFMSLPIQSLYNIFNHQDRILNGHNRAYELIREHFTNNNNSQIFILLESLDGSKLTRSNFEESLSLKEERSNCMPKIDFNYLEKAFKSEDRVNSLIPRVKSKMSQFEAIFEHHKREIDRCIEKYKFFVKEVTEKNEKEKNEIKAHYEKVINDIIAQNEKDKQEMIENNKVYKSEIIEQIKKGHVILAKQREIDKKEYIQFHENYVKMNKRLESLEKEIRSLKQEIANNRSSSVPKIVTDLSLSKDGIIEILSKKSSSNFDRYFIASQSSYDIYNLINPKTEDSFCTNGEEDFYIEFELKIPININGIKIFSSFQCFPKSFDIFVNDKKVKSIGKATELNGKDKMMLVSFPSLKCSKIRFQQTGPNWDTDENSILFKRFELVSTDIKYKKGVFETFIEESENNDPHKCPVRITASCFDFASFQSIQSNKIISVVDDNAWFQVELTRGEAVLSGFRLRKNNEYKMKSFKVLCTNEVNKPIELWTLLIDVNEKSVDDHKNLDIYKFKNPSPPTRFVRIVLTGPTWNDESILMFSHFDLFGAYL